MRILPILFNIDMVRAILGGRKTVTRRLIKPQPQGYFEVNEEPLYIYDADFPRGKIMPTCQPGDILYVRETWCLRYDGEKYFYRADKNTSREERKLIDYDHTLWKPSIHMPKEAARIWLKVTDVRVERLQDMETVDDRNYMAEGAKEKHDFICIWNSTIKKSDLDRYGWGANPWVWVIEFERCKKPEGELCEEN